MAGFGEDKCGVLREIVESIAILASIEAGDLYVKDRLLLIRSNTMDRLSVVKQLCGEYAYSLGVALLDSKIMEEKVLNKFLLTIHECMVKNGCVSNVSVIE